MVHVNKKNENVDETETISVSMYFSEDQFRVMTFSTPDTAIPTTCLGGRPPTNGTAARNQQWEAKRTAA